MKIRDSRCFEFVVCYRGRRHDGRSRTAAFCSHRLASLQGGAPALPKPFQQAPVQSTAVVGRSLPDALRRLDLSRSRGAAGRTPRVAPGAGPGERARFHDAVSLSATSGRCNDRSGGGRDGAPVARHAQKRTTARPRGGRCHGLGTGSGQHLLRAAHAASRAKTAAVEALVEVGGRGGSGSAVSVVADCAPRPLERLWEFACRGRSGFRANAHWPGAGRRRVRQREESHLHPARARGAECNPRQARKENLAHPRSACPDASSPVARLEFQSVSSEASLPFLEDVNRARWLLVTRAPSLSRVEIARARASEILVTTEV